MKFSDWLDAVAARSILDSGQKFLSPLIPSTMRLLTSAVQSEEIPRGFASSADPALCYWAWFDGTDYSFTIRCTCGLIKDIEPDANGRCYYEHIVPMCGWRVEIELEGFKRLTETKEERIARRQQEAENKQSLSGVRVK